MKARTLACLLPTILLSGCGGGVASTPSEPGAPPPRAAQGPQPAPAQGASSSAAWNSIDAEGTVIALVTTKDSVCWTSTSASKSAPPSLVACASKSDGRRTDFVRDAFVHSGLAASSADLYWSTDFTATIDRAPLGGGSAVAVVTKKGPHGRFVLGRGALYWLLDGGAGAVLFAGGIDAAPTEIPNLGPSTTGLFAIDDYTVYDYPRAFFFGDGVKLLRLGSGESPQRLAGSCFHPTDIVAGAGYGYVFWSCEDRTLHWMPQAGGAEHVEANAGGGSIATWRGLAYATDIVGGRVLRIHPAEGKLEIVQTGIDGLTRVAVDDSGIYVGAGSAIRRF